MSTARLRVLAMLVVTTILMVSETSKEEVPRHRRRRLRLRWVRSAQGDLRALLESDQLTDGSERENKKREGKPKATSRSIFIATRLQALGALVERPAGFPGAYGPNLTWKAAGSKPKGKGLARGGASPPKSKDINFTRVKAIRIEQRACQAYRCTLCDFDHKFVEHQAASNACLTLSMALTSIWRTRSLLTL